ncbi:hypothetical protein ACKWTF_005546 [Chironomus riparius]
MALSVSKDDNLPKGAVRLSEEKAYQYQAGIIRNWDNLSEVFGLRAGAGFLAGISGVSSMVILNHFRRKLKLGMHGRVSSYLPVVAMPSALAALFHTTFIERSIVLRKYDCPLCLQSRAAFLQTGIGFVYPFLLAPMASFMFATRHFTVRLPYITEQPKEWLKFWLKLTRSAKHLAPYIVLANIIGAVGITSLEFHEYEKLQMHFEEHERKVESGFYDK